MKRWSDLKDKVNDFANQVQDNAQQQNKNKSQSNYHQNRNNFQTSNPEQVLGTMWSYFFAMWIGIFISLFAIIFLISKPKTSFLAILILIAIPFWVIFCILMMIPDVKIFGVTVFSRKNLSLRKSVSLGKRLVYVFSKEFYRQNPLLASILVVYVVLILFAIIYAVI